MSQADIRAKVVAIHEAKRKKASEILNIMSYFSSENISAKMFTDFAGGTKKLESAVEFLKQYSVVNLSQQDPTMLNISELTQQVIRTILKEKNKEQITLIKALKLFEIMELESFHLNCAVSTWRYANAYPKIVEFFGMLPSNIVQKLGKCGRYEEAYSFGVEQLKLGEALNYICDLRLRYQIGNVLLKLKKFEEALRILDDPIYKGANIFLSYAAEEGNLETTIFLAENKGIVDSFYHGRSLLYCAIKGNSLEVVKFLVEKGVDFHSLDSLRQSSVHFASQVGNLDIVKFFVESGADFESYDDDFKTPLHYAAEEGRLDVVKFLVGNGADVNFADRYGKTSIHYATEVGSLGMVKFLVENGAIVNATDKDGKTSLHRAADIGNLDAVKILIKKGGDLNAIDENHMTPLDYAIKRLDPVKPIDHKGGTQLHYAVYYGRVQLVQNLLTRVNNYYLHDFINLRTKGGNSALDLAIKAGNKNIIKILDQALQEAPYTDVENESMAGSSEYSWSSLEDL